jgi:prepilin-type N-terminal cleavage/methylation domain-containing protein
MMNKNGFTLVELMIALGIAMGIGLTLYFSINMAQRSSTSVSRKVITQQDARTVLDIMAMEIRMTSLNMTMSRTIWNAIPTTGCGSMGNIVPWPANKGLQVAGPNTILIAMDLGGRIEPGGANVPSGIIGDAPSEYIEYALGTNTITRNVSCGGDNDILGGEDLSTTVRNGGLGIPLFQYYNSAGNITANIPQIRRVRITIVADTRSPDALTGQAKRMTYTTDVLVKNHVFSP